MVMPCLFFNRLRRFSFLSLFVLVLTVVNSPDTHAQFSGDDYGWSLSIEETSDPESPRLVASILTVALGVFGVHRMYLGTDLRVPVFYTLTLGGGMGVLPLIDLGCILFTSDLEQYYNHSGVFMWVPQKKPTP